MTSCDNNGVIGQYSIDTQHQALCCSNELDSDSAVVPTLTAFIPSESKHGNAWCKHILVIEASLAKAFPIISGNA